MVDYQPGFPGKLRRDIMNQEIDNSEPESSTRPATNIKEIVFTILSWIITAFIVIGLVGFGVLNPLGLSSASYDTPTATPVPSPAQTLSGQNPEPTDEPSNTTEVKTIVRAANSHTEIETKSRASIIQYTVAQGDSVFSLAKQYNITPESLLWANESALNDSADALSPGITLNIPPVDGVYYQWKKGDTVESVAKEYKAKEDDILNYPGNKIDLSNPSIGEGSYIMIPGGSQELMSWANSSSGEGTTSVSASAFGPNGCSSTGGASGSGSFIWPTANHFLSGNDYYSGHLGIDIAADFGAGIVAADSGVVTYAGWSDTGYGNLVIINHGNGYQTFYGHLSDYYVSCGQSVSQGEAIGASGATGNATGAHLHFEVRYGGASVDPWSMLQ
jgi:murein DD-endopeptidase MepM/ murein hydrolase activator NlpD